ncbi:PREDICTED: transcriptional regulator SUPERMAN-like [Populus euphratica]|uniref:Transcriptional regulator SUPERMAN-like n=1 Tax=Populus euphratica TaxID=75702 RepID=A0AAJ6T7B7_POPEU|nr:PREDICTED: transcriptional regulator SUPERMAN-like [Populus euphratica]
MVEKDNDTSSDERTVTSKLRSGYICSLCDREFKSGHALSGHYNAHSKKRKRKYVPGTVGKVIRVLVPSIDVEPPVARKHGSEFTHGAPTPGVQSGVDYETGDESSSTRPQGGLKKNINLNIETHRSHPCERDVNDEAPRGGGLLNITTLIHGVKINNGVDMDLARTITNPIVKASGKENGDAKFTSGKNGDEDLDLELRLGLGPA